MIETHPEMIATTRALSLSPPSAAAASTDAVLRFIVPSTPLLIRAVSPGYCRRNLYQRGPGIACLPNRLCSSRASLTLRRAAQSPLGVTRSSTAESRLACRQRNVDGRVSPELYPEPMDLTIEQLDLLRVIDELEAEGTVPGTRAAGERLVAVWRKRGGGHSWIAYAPWHGTQPYAEELQNAGLLKVHGPMAQFRQWDQPAATIDQYTLSLTDAGRSLLASSDSDDADHHA
jgi:hypothetical protein